MQGADPPPAVGQTVNHDVTARCDTALSRRGDVVRIWIGDMQSEMKRAVRLVMIDGINAFRGALIALLLLRPNWLLA